MCEVSRVGKLVRSFYFLKNLLTKKTCEQVTNSRTLWLCSCIWIWGGTAKRRGHYLVESISITSKFDYRLVCPSKGLTSLSSTLPSQTKPNYNKWVKQNASFRFWNHINKVENYLLDGAHFWLRYSFHLSPFHLFILLCTYPCLWIMSKITR